MTKTKNHILYIYLLLFLLTILFFSKNEALTNNGVVIPFININPIYLLLAILLLGVVYTFLQSRFIIDAISGILFLRIFLCLIPLMYIIDVPSAYWGNLIVACFPFLIYTFFLNNRFQVEKAVRIFIFFGIILGLQCLLAYSIIINSGYATYFDPWYKGYFVIPAGATNDLSAILLPLLILGDLTIEKNRYRWPFVLLMVISIVLTKSRTGIILSILFFLTKLFIKEKGRSNLWKRILIVVLPIALVIAFLVIPKESAIFQSLEIFFRGFADSDDSINGLLSGRLDVFSNVIHKIGEHPIFGNGVAYAQLKDIRSHNVFLGILYENGIVGLLFFFVFLYIAFKRIIRMRKCNKYYYAFFIIAPFILINSMVEEILFRYPIVLLGLIFLASMKNDWKDEGINHV